jgi:isovaleryl-CoA dehydrogenase
VRDFAASEVEPQALAFNREERFNEALFRRAGALGLLGVSASPAWGGAGMDAAAVAIVHEELSASDPAFCLSYLAHSLLFVNNLNVNGSDAQRAAFLPRACAGELLAGMAMSEPGAGTDVLAMSTRCVRDARDGSFVLTGSKMWITNGARDDRELGDVFLVYARDGGDDDGGGGGGGGGSAGAKPSYSLFLVEKGAPGFSLGQRIKDKCGMRASATAELVLDGVRVPARNLVGARGSALLSMMRNLEVERLGLAAMSLGIARRCIDVMNAHAQARSAFGAPLNRHGQIQRHIADSYADFAAGRAYVYATAQRMDLARAGGRLDSDGVKLYCAPMATAVASRAMQTLGGYGYVGEYAVERLWRDARLLEIGGGTNESHQKNITKDLAGKAGVPW